MGIIPSEIVQMPARDFDLLARYWLEEPWGPWRDNMHAAIIAREIRRPYLKDTRKNLLSHFLMRNPIEIAAENSKKITGLFSFFKTVATKVSSADLKKMMPKRKRKQRVAGHG